MVDDSELDYLRTFLTYACLNSTVKHFSEVKKISAINDTRRILIYPGELLSVDGKFYKKRYRVQLSEPSEANLINTFNSLINGIESLSKGITIGSEGVLDYFDCSGEIATDMMGVCYDGKFYWVSGGVDAYASTIFKYNYDGSYTGFSFLPAITYVDAINYDNGYLWITDATKGSVYKYNILGVYQSVEIDVSGKTDEPYGITFDNNYLYIYGHSEKNVFKYTKTGSYISFFDCSSEVSGNVEGLCTDGTYIYVSDYADYKAFQYSMDGVYQSHYIDTSGSMHSPNGRPFGMEFDGKYFCWASSGINVRVYRFNSLYNKPSTLVYLKLAYGNRAFENGKTKRWYQDIFIDVEWSTE